LGWQFGSAAGRPTSNIVAIAQSNDAQVAEQKKKMKVTPVFSSTDEALKTVPNGVPGVILKPDVKASDPAAFAAPTTLFHAPLNKVASFPFTGEYHLFPTSTITVPDDSLRLAGTPLDARYKTFTDQPVETEAYQVLRPPGDFTNCGTFQIFIRNQETVPGLVNVQLLAGGSWVELGSSLFGFGLTSKHSTPTETLQFEVPLRVPRTLLVSAIRIQFHRAPSLNNRTAKIAVDRFELLPRH
jgi:hypothetical protein